MNDLRNNGIKTNHKKGFAEMKRVQKRIEAEARNAKYQTLPLEVKLARNSSRVKSKLENK